MYRSCFRILLCAVLLFTIFPVGQVLAQEPDPGITTVVFSSIALQDGLVIETGEESNTGGSMNATLLTMRVGDDALNRQYRSILSFNTAALPDNAVVISATLKLKRQGITGENPFTTHNKLFVEIRKPSFGNSPALAVGDFEAVSELAPVGVIASEPVAGYHTAKIQQPGWASINLTGLTQLRLRFQLDDNNNHVADYLSFFSGNAADPAQNPALEIKYYLPLLPNDLYYLGRMGSSIDGQFKHQIYRLGKDGKTVTQITNEPGWGVSGFDISSDGKITYGVGHKLMITDSNGKNRQVLFEKTEDVYSPIWSPDGKTIVWHASVSSGLYLYTLATHESTLLLPGAEKPSIGPFNRGFSPDGKKLALWSTLSAPDGAIYDFASKTVTPILSPPNQAICYNRTWSTPNSLLCSSAVLAINHIPGLWRINANDGSVETLISSPSPTDVKLVTAPRQDLTGKLYYLYAEIGGGRTMSFSLMRSDLDGVTNRTALRFAGFSIADTTWTPDNTGVVVHGDYNRDNISDLILVPIDPALPTIKFSLDASKIEIDSFRWAP